MWTREEAIELCTAIEKFAPNYGCHVALTGGLLYKEGLRKDADIMFYRIRQVDDIDIKSLFAALTGFGITLTTRHGWVHKATYKGMDIDFFFPEYTTGMWEKTLGFISSDIGFDTDSIAY